METYSRDPDGLSSVFFETRDPLISDRRQGMPVEGEDRYVGTRLGRYLIERVISTGGMGTVYLAKQDEPPRPVALKLMRRGVSSPSALRRFRFEAELLARLRHPGIAQIFDAGTHEDGAGPVPYFAMEFVPGARDIVEHVESAGLGLRACLELFAKVCDAVAHGHQKGIIHRDLKPSNILVDEAGEPRIIDFGVARATDADLTRTSVQTERNALLGTLQYMSPEQCTRDALDLDTSSDVYALGLVLYELLCRRRPYEIGDTPVLAAVQTIRECEPERPSKVDRRLRGDVETIVLKALDKDRTRRYRTAADLGDEIRRYLNDVSISARPPGPLDALRRFGRRHTAIAASIVASFVVLALALVVVIEILHATRVSFAEARVDSNQAALAARDLWRHRMAEAPPGWRQDGTPAAAQTALDAAERAERLLRDGNAGEATHWFLQALAALDRLLRREDATDLARSPVKLALGSGGGFDPVGPGARLGSALTGTGDIDRDGIDDLAVGAPGVTVAGTPCGAILMLMLDRDGQVRSERLVSSGRGGLADELAAGDGFGSSLASIGDLDGDGIRELAVGAAGHDAGGANRGAVWILFPNRDGTVRHHEKIGHGAGGFGGALRDGDRFGIALGALGDLDGDGVGDLAVGAVDDHADGRRGNIWILLLQRDGTVRSHRRIDAEAGFEHGAFGLSLDAVGDLDGDGVTELAVGAADYSGAGQYEGAVSILFLDETGGERDRRTITGQSGGFRGTPRGGDGFGTAVANIGDLDGDGLDDLAVGAPGDGGGGTGAIWLLSLRRDGTVRWHRKMSAAHGGVAEILTAGDHFGCAVTSIGDLDGDGRRELVVGARGDDGCGGTCGAAWVLFLGDVSMQATDPTHDGSVDSLDLDR